MSKKRIIEHTTDLTLRSDDYILKDSATNDTKKITPEAFVEGALDNYLAGYVSGLDSASASSDSDIFYTVADGVQKKVSKSTIFSADRTARTTAEGTIVANFAQEYSTTTQYAVGDYCIKDLVLYKCISPTSGTWDSSKWTQVTALDLTSGVASDLADEIEARQSADEALQGEIDELPVDVQVDGGSLVNEDNIAVLDSLVAYGEASGEIATFSDGSDLAMKSLKVAIEPQQDLHGYDAPWVGGAGKNKLDFTDTTVTSSRTIASDISLKAGDYIVAFDIKNNSNIEGYYQVRIGTTGIGGVNFGANYSGRLSKTFTLSEDSVINIFVAGASSGYSFEFSKGQIELGSTATTFAPYSNICPIIGWSSANVSVASKNLSKSQTNNSVLCSAKKGVTYTVSFEGNVGANIKKNTNSGEVVIWGAQLPLTFTADDDFNIFLNAWSANISNIQVEVGNRATAYEPYNGHTYTIDLDGTRYGGTIDVVSGVLTVDRVEVDLGTLTWTKETWGSGVDFYITLTIAKLPPDDNTKGNIISSQYENLTRNQLYNSSDNGISLLQGGALKIRDSRYSEGDATAFKTAMNGVQAVYELATPQTIQLTPTQVKSLLGANNVWADTGDILDAEYVRDLTSTINYILEQLNS